MKKQFGRNKLLYFFMLFLCIGCSKNNNPSTLPEPDSGETYTVTYRINVQRTTDVYALEEEMMKTILVIVVNSSNEIEEIIDIELPQTVEQHIVESQLTPGAKEVYGFANLNASMRAQAGLDNLNIGDPMPNLTNTVLTINNGYEIDENVGNWLPMSNKVAYTVTYLSSQRFSMELIRLVCKVHFTFKNETGEEISLQELTFSPVTDSPVYLMPAGGGVPVFPAGVTQTDYIHNFDNTYVIADKEEIEYILYLNETQVDNNDWFQIRLVTERTSDNEIEERMAVTNLTYLNRNDYLPLPIIITDYRLELDVKSYPPIGGYPASVTETNDGYHCIFNGGGPFVITPTLIRLSDESVVPVDNQDWSFTYVDTTPSFFDELPVLKEGEITGTIKVSASGSVLFTVSVNISTSENITRTLTYKIYISQN